MRELRESYENLAASPKGVSRLARFRWWFIALLILGVAAGIYILVRGAPEFYSSFMSIAGTPLLITQAFAQSAPASSTPDYKPLIMLAIIVTLLIILLGSVWRMLTSTNADTVKAASDLVKLLVGFFVGVATKYIGA
jgi:hypothetical protein